MNTPPEQSSGGRLVDHLAPLAPRSLTMAHTSPKAMTTPPPLALEWAERLVSPTKPTPTKPRASPFSLAAEASSDSPSLPSSAAKSTSSPVTSQRDVRKARAPSGKDGLLRFFKVK